MGMKTKFDNELKAKLQSFEPQGVTAQWSKLSRDLPKATKPLWQNLLLYLGVAVVVSTVLILVFQPKDNKNEQPLLANSSTDTLVTNNQAPHDDVMLENIEDKSSSQTKSEIIPTQTTSDVVSNASNTENHDNIKQQPSKNNNLKDNKPTESVAEIVPENQETPEKEDDKTEETLFVSVSVNELCVPAKVKFTSNANPDDYEFFWNFKDGEKSNEISPTHEYKKPGEYKPVLTLTPRKENLESCRVFASSIHCYGMVDVKINVDKTGNHYTFNTNDSGLSYEWNINNQRFTSSLVEYDFKQDGLYDISLKLTDTHACSLDLSKKLDVLIEHNYEMPNAFRPDGGGVNAYFGPIYDNDFDDWSFTMMIFDKYNQLVYKTDDVQSPWDGLNIYTNQKAEAGVYLWKIVTKDTYGNVRTRTGQVTLLRN